MAQNKRRGFDNSSETSLHLVTINHGQIVRHEADDGVLSIHEVPRVAVSVEVIGYPIHGRHDVEKLLNERERRRRNTFDDCKGA